MDIVKVRSHIAAKYGYVLGENDPVLVSVTILELLRDEMIADMETVGRRVAASLAGGATDPAAAGKAAASKLINEAGAWSVARFKEASAAASTDIRASATDVLAAIQSEIRAVRHAKSTAIGAALVSVAVACVGLGGGIGFWLAGR